MKDKRATHAAIRRKIFFERQSDLAVLKRFQIEGRTNKVAACSEEASRMSGSGHEAKAFWEEQTAQLHAIAAAAVRGTRLPPHVAIEDLVQDALTVAFARYDASVAGRTVTPDLQEHCRKEAMGYAVTSLKNDFIDLVRKRRNWRALVQNLDNDVVNELWGKPPITAATPESGALSTDVLRIAEKAAEKSPIYRKIVDAVRRLLARGEELSLNSADLAEMAGVTANQRRDFGRRFMRERERMEEIGEERLKNAQMEK